MNDHIIIIVTIMMMTIIPDNLPVDPPGAAAGIDDDAVLVDVAGLDTDLEVVGAKLEIYSIIFFNFKYFKKTSWKIYKINFLFNF